MRCVKCGVAQYSYHIDCLLETLALSWLELVLSVAMTLQPHLTLITPIYIRHFIFSSFVCSTRSTHLPPFRFTTLYSCYWYSILLFRCECLTLSYTSNRTLEYNYLRWVWNRLIQCFGSFINKLVGWKITYFKCSPSNYIYTIRSQTDYPVLDEPH